MIVKYWRLYLSNLTGFLSFMSVGEVYLYPVAGFPGMRFGGEPLSPSLTSWFASFDGIFGVLGCILVIPLMHQFGRKLATFVISVVMSVGWLLQVCTYNVATLAVSRTITGIGVGMVFGCLFVYIAEISPKERRGVMAAIPSIFLGLGAILVNLLGNAMNWRWIALVCFLISLSSCLTSIFIYETPRWLISRGERAMAMEVMEKLWMIDELQLRKEADDMEKNVKLVGTRGYFETLMTIVKPPLLKPLIISQVLIALEQFIGSWYLNSYTVTIFHEVSVGTNNTHKIQFFNPGYQNALVWTFFIVGTVASIFVIDRFGRRVLLVSNVIVIIVNLVLIGIYFCLKESLDDFHFRRWHWLPITCLLVYNFCLGCGVQTVPYLLLSELFPTQARVVASSLGMISLNFYFFLFEKFIIHSKALPAFGVYWVFASVGVFGLVFVVFLVPETNGRSLEEIHQQWYRKNTPKIEVYKQIKPEY